MSGDKAAGKPKPCPGCGDVPRMSGAKVGKASKHCDTSPTCTWAKCNVCATVWDIDTGENFHD